MGTNTVIGSGVVDYPMDTTELAAELQSADPELPPDETAFIEAVENAQAALEAGEIGQGEYYERVMAASEQYRDTTDSDRGLDS